MSKIKLALIAVAIFTAVGGAFATSYCATCENSQQYYYNGGGYVPVGTYGMDYDCVFSGTVCTYYKANPVTQPDVYTPCRIGGYTPF